ncbi:hypothetical protein CPB85DRAFT_1375650 [Mucidula mucida]|nr:hypothetical protein CPB85DRAFT_1375650 [Mucidula mucida]
MSYHSIASLVLCEMDNKLPSVDATACLTPEAAEWFVAGSHKLFCTNSPSSAWAKCFRKAVLSHIEHWECSLNEAAMHYIMFLTAVHQAIKAVQGMVKCPDFDRRMLLLATQVSHQSENRLILLTALKALLNTLKVPSGGETLVEAMTLIQHILKLVLWLLTETAPNKPLLIDMLLEHFQRSKVFVKTARTQKSINFISKDLSWLWRTAYNCAVQGCSEWAANHEQILDLFDMARDISYFLHLIQEISEKAVVLEEIFEVELLALLKDWDGMSSIVGDTVLAGPLAASTYKAITDILWAEKDCPVDGSLDYNLLSIEKFSRWLRTICITVLARNSLTDRAKAISYVEQAVSVIEQSIDSDEAYPMDERFWLLSMSYNTGFECLESAFTWPASALDEAKR